MYEATGFKQLLFDAGYTPQEVTDTCLDLLSIYQYAAYMGDYDPDFSGCDIDPMDIPADTRWREHCCNAVADCYVFGHEPRDHWAFSDYPPDVIDEVIDLYEFKECALDGDLLNMLDIWLMGMPAEFIVPEEWQIGAREARIF